MKKLLEAAVLNNISWCGLICETHGISNFTKGNVWGLMSEAPPYYPDLITTSQNATSKEVMEVIKDKNIKSLKDSFATLNLESYDFRVLFDAEWIFHPPVTPSKKINANWTTITSRVELANWNIVNGTENIILPSILKRDDVKLFIREKEGKFTGFIANVGAGVVGVSNVVSAEGLNEDIWKEIVQVVSTHFSDLYLVGYEQGEDLIDAISSGWKSLGPLRVWINTVESD